MAWDNGCKCNNRSDDTACLVCDLGVIPAQGRRKTAYCWKDKDNDLEDGGGRHGEMALEHDGLMGTARQARMRFFSLN
ncbi:hypothetical protein J6590_072711 [Homalodisca vitripennis]|nr:hypothetical protein J6590_072711 [Homalodisca vitripennis]